MGGVLDTGDIGFLDSDNCLYLTGRKSRITKICGVRINLDEMQDYLRDKNIDCSLQTNDPEGICIQYCGTIDVQQFKHDLARNFGIPQTTISVTNVSSLVRLENGKLRVAKNNAGSPA